MVLSFFHNLFWVTFINFIFGSNVKGKNWKLKIEIKPNNKSFHPFFWTKKAWNPKFREKSKSAVFIATIIRKQS